MNYMPKQVKSVAKGISILGIAGIICKVVGVLFSIPLNMISTEAATLFYLVYPTYTLLLTISSAGLPVAVSRMVAGFLAKDDPENGRNTFRAALVMLLSIGSLFSLLMIAMNHQLAGMVKVEETSYGFYVIAPCVAIVCALSAFRGFFQGQQNMLPTAVSQLIEQVGKVIISLPLAYIGIHVYHSVTLGAAGALLGITIAEASALVYMIIRYFLKKKEYSSILQAPDQMKIESGKLMKRLGLISVPITISACIIPLSQFIDSAMMIDRMIHAGLDLESAKRAYGLFTSVVIRLINIPTALALAISMSLVPVISYCRSINDMEGIRRESHTGLRFASLIGFPCSVGMSLLSHEIVSFFYGGVASFSDEHIQLASELLTFSAMTVILFTLVQATSSILQGLRKQKIPMYTMIAGVSVKIILNYLLIGTRGIDIHGGPYASIACYFLVMALNILFVCKYGEMKFDWTNWIIRPGAAAGIMGCAVWAIKSLLPPGRLSTILEVITGIAVFIAAAFLVKAVHKEDLNVIRRRKQKT